jgi:hypothetical protein
VHAVALVAPVTPEYVPVGHKTHVPAPASEYAPAGQLAQTLALLAPVAPEYVPAGQSTQDAYPLKFLNFPATQAVHTLLFPAYPIWHLQSEIDFDAPVNSEVENCGHDEHCVVCENIRTSFR